MIKKDNNKEKEKMTDKNSEQNIQSEESNEIVIERVDNNNETIEELNQSDEKEELIFLRKKTSDLEKEMNELKDRLLRKAAEFENYKRRNENDQINLIKYAAESFIIKLLPTIDNFERSMKHLDDTKDIGALKSGIRLIYENFIKVLDEQGVKKIESLNQPFDVTFHEALMQRTAEGVPPHTVVDEVETGYLYKDKVIRHAKVVVSDENSNSDSSDEQQKGNNEVSE